MKFLRMNSLVLSFTGVLFLLLILVPSISLGNTISPSDLHWEDDMAVKAYYRERIFSNNSIVPIKKWTREQPREWFGPTYDDDPCSKENGLIDDTIYWFDPNGFSNNYMSDTISLEISNKAAFAYIAIRGGMVGLHYGRYPEIFRGYYGICLSQNIDYVALDEIRLVRSGSRLYQPYDINTFTSNNQVEFNWEINPYDNGEGIVVFWAKEGGSSGYERAGRYSFTHKLNEQTCKGQYYYWFASFKEGGEKWYSKHSRWTGEIPVTVNENCVGSVDDGSGSNDGGSSGGNDGGGSQPQPTATPTPTATPESCSDHGNGVYLYRGYNKTDSCQYVGEGETKSLNFSPKSVDIRGNGVNVNLCSTSDGSQPCSEVNNDSGDLSWSSIFGKFKSAKVRPGYTSNCTGNGYTIELYSGEDHRGSCYELGPGRHSLPFSPRSLKFNDNYMSINLCKESDGGNPCSEWDDDQDSLSDSSIYGSFRSAVINIKELRVGDFQLQATGWTNDNTQFYFKIANIGGGGVGNIPVLFTDDPKQTPSYQAKTIELKGDGWKSVSFSTPLGANAICFYYIVDPNNLFAETNENNNIQSHCKNGSHLQIPANDQWLPENSLILGDNYLFAPVQMPVYGPDYGPGWDTTAMLITIPGHRPKNWTLSTPHHAAYEVYDPTGRINLINMMLDRCNGEGNGCREVHEAIVNEDGSIEKLVHTQHLNTPTPTATPTLTPTPTPTITPVIGDLQFNGNWEKIGEDILIVEFFNAGGANYAEVTAHLYQNPGPNSVFYNTVGQIIGNQVGYLIFEGIGN